MSLGLLVWAAWRWLGDAGPREENGCGGKLDLLTTLETGSKQALFVWKRAKVREMSREVRGKSVED